MGKRKASRFVVAGLVTGVYAAAALSARNDIGKESAMTADKAVKVGITAALMTGLTWLVATL